MEIGGSTEAVQTRRPSRHLTGSARTDNRLVSGLWAGGQPGRGRLKSRQRDHAWPSAPQTRWGGRCELRSFGLQRRTGTRQPSTKKPRRGRGAGGMPGTPDADPEHGRDQPGPAGRTHVSDLQLHLLQRVHWPAAVPVRNRPAQTPRGAGGRC